MQSKELQAYFAYRNINSAIEFAEDSDREILSGLLAKYREIYAHTDERDSFICTQCNVKKPLSSYLITTKDRVSTVCNDCKDRTTAIGQIKSRVLPEFTGEYERRKERAYKISDSISMYVCGEERCPAFIKYKRAPIYSRHFDTDADFRNKFYSECKTCRFRKRIEKLGEIRDQCNDKIAEICDSFNKHITEDMIQLRIVMAKLNSKLRKSKI